jgi:AMP-polyphosphate phosphotransferase
MKNPSLSKLLRHKKAFLPGKKPDANKDIEKLQLKMLRVQQGNYHTKSRAVIVFEGFDASGKGGAIRKLTEVLDPRGIRVHAIGPPLAEEQNRHWLYRFWTRVPEPGTIAIFDRSWYGRVLVERVDKLTEKKVWKRAYDEINDFERMLTEDGIDVIKIFLAVTKEEQLKRFEDRLSDPYKQWKISKDDIRARKKWSDYVDATDDLLKRTHTKSCPWHLIPADQKSVARLETLKVVTSSLKDREIWMEIQAEQLGNRTLEAALKELGE